MTRVPFLDLRRRTAASRAEIEATLARVLDAGRFVGGSEVERFEEAFAAYCGVLHAVGVASGTDAVELALRAAGIGDGDEVITVANTCVPTVAAIASTGATPVLVDPDPATMVMESDRVESAITKRTRAVVVVHLYGRLAPIEEIVTLARNNGLRVVEDCAQAHGAVRDGVRAGAFADIGAFSFYPTKNLGAFGDAGAIVTDDPELAERTRLYREYGERARYDSVREGRNSRLDTLQAALLSVLLPGLDAGNVRRRAIARRYDGALGDGGLVLPPPPAGDDHVYHLYVLRHPARDEFRRRLGALGVETLVHYPKAIHQHPAYATLGSGRDLSVSEQLAAEVVSLPLFPELEDDEVEAVAEAARSAAGVLAAEQPLT